MTKHEFSKIIIDTVNNMNLSSINEEEQIKAISLLISPLIPKNIKRFAKWGQPHQTSTPSECW